MAAAQIGHLHSSTVQKGKSSDKTWPLITSAHPQRWPAQALLQARRDYWAIEGVFHQRLDETFDEDRSRLRSPRGMTVLAMFRRLAASLATAWLASPRRRQQKQSARDFLAHLRAHNARRAFSLATSLQPNAWIHA